MPLEIRIPKPGEAEAGGLIADRRLCLTRDDRLVEDGALDAVMLLAGEGGLIPGDVVTHLGLELIDGRVVQHSSEPAIAEPKSKPAAAPKQKP
jgi:hypothetical protein